MRYIFIPLIILLTAYAQAASLTAQVISIIDGDTITILTPAKQQIKVRLADIDAPELRRRMGKAGREKVFREFDLKENAAELLELLVLSASRSGSH